MPKLGVCVVNFVETLSWCIRGPTSINLFTVARACWVISRRWWKNKKFVWEYKGEKKTYFLASPRRRSRERLLIFLFREQHKGKGRLRITTKRSAKCGLFKVRNNFIGHFEVARAWTRVGVLSHCLMGLICGCCLFFIGCYTSHFTYKERVLETCLRSINPRVLCNLGRLWSSAVLRHKFEQRGAKLRSLTGLPAGSAFRSFLLPL